MTTVALVGAGGIADLHLPALLTLGHDVVVFSGSDSARRLVDRHGGRVAGSLADALSECDVVDICTPTSTHRDLTVQAAELGKHVICEKPLALTLDDARDMRDVCDRAGVSLFPAHVVRFFPEYAALHQAVRRGELGTLSVQTYSRTVSTPTMDWFWDPAQSGGIATEVMIHDLDFARWCGGDVTSVVATQSGDNGRGRPTAVQATLTHASGVTSHITGACGDANAQFRTEFDVTGTLGRADYDSVRAPSGLPIGPYIEELREFVSAALSGTPSRISAGDGIAAVELALAVNESLATCEAVAIGGVR